MAKEIFELDTTKSQCAELLLSKEKVKFLEVNYTLFFIVRELKTHHNPYCAHQAVKKQGELVAVDDEKLKVLKGR